MDGVIPLIQLTPEVIPAMGELLQVCRGYGVGAAAAASAHAFSLRDGLRGMKRKFPKILRVFLFFSFFY